MKLPLTHYVRWMLTLACAILAAVWLVSAWRWVNWRSAAGPWWGIGQGQFTIGWIAPGVFPEIATGWQSGHTPLQIHWWFYWETYAAGGWTLVTPLWILAALPALGVLAIVRWQSRQLRAVTTQCEKCHYDLSASADLGRCPECGSIAPAHRSPRSR